jgi:hypothetical protein
MEMVIIDPVSGQEIDTDLYIDCYMESIRNQIGNNAGKIIFNYIVASAGKDVVCSWGILSARVMQATPKAITLTLRVSGLLYSGDVDVTYLAGGLFNIGWLDGDKYRTKENLSPYHLGSELDSIIECPKSLGGAEYKQMALHDSLQKCVHN